MKRFAVRAVLIAGAVGISVACATAQEVVITGRVTNEAGLPLGSASVLIEQMRLGAQTNDAGVYRFTVPTARAQGQSVTLSTRLIGYRPNSAPITLQPGTITHDFVLTTAQLILQQVVITGAGTITTSEKLGNKIDMVQGTDIANSHETNVVEALAGKAPNIIVTSQSGDPGASSSIMIRGIKSFSGDGQPLFVVDGVPLDNSTINVDANNAGVVAPNRMSDINPDDIESINILKGAAAAAIYGARAAQGVVLITTKSGKPGQTRYSLRSSYSMDDVNKRYPLQTKFGQGTGGLSGACFGIDQVCTRGKFSYGPELTPAAYKAGFLSSSCNAACADARFAQLFPSGLIPTYDHFAELFEQGHEFNSTLSVSGGDDRRTFYLSAARDAHNGYIVGNNDNYNRSTLRLKATQKLSDRFQVGGNLAYVDTRGSFIQRGNNVSGIMLGSLRTPPEFNNQNFLDPTSHLHRSYRFPNPSAATVRNGRGYDNPFFVINEETATSSLSRVFGNVDLDYQPMDWLTFKYTGGGDYYSDERLEAFPLTNSTLPSGALNRANFVNYVLDHNLLAIAQKTFNPNFASSVTVGQNLNSTRFRQIYASGTNLLAPEPFKLSNAVTIVANDGEQNVHRESYFGQLTFDLFSQLYLTGAVRQDGSSAFAQNNRRHWYPKASAAWTFSDALHGRWSDKLDFAKARVAYGVTGKEPAPYSTIPAYGVNLFCDYGGVYCNRTVFQGQGGLLSPTTRPNDKLRPERTRENEYGLDFGFWRGFADLSLTYYDSKSDDVIFGLPLSPSSGYTLQVQNAATITNKGTEVTLNLHPLRRTALGWDLSLLWSRNRNRVQSITGAEEVVVGSGNFGQSVAKPGYPVGSIEEFDFARCRYGEANVINGVDINAYCTAHKAPQGALYIDDGSVGEAGFPFVDYTPRIVGSWEPKWQGSIRNAFRFGKIQVSGLLDIKKGGQAWDGTRGALYSYGTHKDTEIRGGTFAFGPSAGSTKGYYTNSVTGPGAGTAVVIDQGWFQDLGGAFGDNGAQFVEDAGYVKLREISVAYTLDRPFVKRLLGLSSVDLRVAGRNLKTWTNYQGIDPESNLAGASGFIQGFDWFNNPQTRSVVISIGLNR